MSGTAASTSSSVNALGVASLGVAKSKREKPLVGLARSRSDLHGAFTLLYQAYLDAGLEAKKPSGIRITPYHLLPTTEVLVSKLHGEVISTMSLVGDGYLGLPMQSMYSEQINGLRDQGLRVAEVGGLADRRESPVRFIENFKKMSRLIIQVAAARGIDVLVVATHPRHARFYIRTIGFEQFGDVSDCPYAQGNPAVALAMNLNERHLDPEWHKRHFGDPIPGKEIAHYRWDSDTREYFKKILQQDRSITATKCVQGGLASASISGVLTC